MNIQVQILIGPLRQFESALVDRRSWDLRDGIKNRSGRDH